MHQCTKCIVKGCANKNGEGRFVGNLCAPCHTMLTDGHIGHSSAWFVVEIAKLRNNIQAIKDVVDDSS